MRRGTDDFKKPGNGDSFNSETLFGSAIVAFRVKTTINLILHLIFAALYAFEHNNQVLRYSDAINVDTETTVSDVVYTPAGNIVVMVLNLILCLLTAQITVNIDSQIEHI